MTKANINHSTRGKLGFLVEGLCSRAFGLVESIRRWTGRRPVETITLSELLSSLEDTKTKLVVVDVRSQSERRVSRIPGSISLDEYRESQSQYSERIVVPYCTIGGRSYLCAAKFANQGIPVKNFSEGILGWCRAGRPLELADGTPTNRVHTYWRIFQIPAPYEFAKSPASIDHR